MKQKDIVLILAVGFVSGVFSIVLSNMLFSTKKLNIPAEQADAITSQFPIPQNDDTVFNAGAVDPTQLIQIGDSSNTNAL